MKLGNSEVEVNENFRLYLLTALPNPSFLPSVCNRVNVVNFTITFDCLVKQLLSSTVQHVQPELERNLIQLLGQVDKDKITLQTLEDKALFMLEHREGHLLDDQILVETLHRTKVMSEEIQVLGSTYSVFVERAIHSQHSRVSGKLGRQQGPSPSSCRQLSRYLKNI